MKLSVYTHVILVLSMTVNVRVSTFILDCEMTLYDKLTINKFINGSFKEFKDMNLDIAMEDMIRYIEKMGGVVNETPSDYTIFSPILWTGKIYQRFTSFGIKPFLPPQTKPINYLVSLDGIDYTIADYSC